MSYRFIQFERDQGVATITLDRPEVLNAFHREMAAELQSALQTCLEEAAIRCLLLTGAGRAFSAGQDLSEVSVTTASLEEIADKVEENYNRTIRLICHMEKPVVCAVNGVAAGAGANIALACDIVLASETASFIQSFSRIGLVPDSGGTYFLPRLVGIPRAKAMMMLGEKVSASDARDMGLIYRTCPPQDLQSEARKLSAHLASQPTRGLGLTKRAINSSLNADLDSQLQVERQLQAMAAKTADFREGVEAFLEKRKPIFKGE